MGNRWQQRRRFWHWQRLEAGSWARVRKGLESRVRKGLECEGVGVGEFEPEIDGGGGASAALSKVVGSTSAISARRICGGYEPGYGYLSATMGVAAKRQARHLQRCVSENGRVKGA
jgi:hypothetical protein